MDNFWHKTPLESYLLYDSWTTDFAIDVLTGFDPNASSLNYGDVPGVEFPFTEITMLFCWPFYRDDNFSWESLKDHEIYNIFLDASTKRDRLKGIWSYSDHIEEDVDMIDGIGMPMVRSPKWYIEYFDKKRFTPIWLDWAKSEDLINNEDEAKDLQEKNENPKLIESSQLDQNRTPHELDLAIRAYKFALQKLDEGSNRSPQNLIKEFLEENTQDKNKKQKNYCSKAGIERIMIVANWAKEGGLKKL